MECLRVQKSGTSLPGFVLVPLHPGQISLSLYISVSSSVKWGIIR